MVSRNPHGTVETNFQRRFSVCVVRYDRWRVDWSRYFRRSCDRKKLPKLYVKWTTRTTRGRSCGHTDCYALPAWRGPFSLYPTYYATSHDTFSDWWIGRGSTIHWPPRSPDLSHLHFCLWGWMKSKVYRRKVDTRDELLDHIMDVIALIRESQDAHRRATHHILI
jgi:hypothetical protein